MPASTLTFFNQFKEDLGEKIHNLATDSFKVAFTNSAPDAATHDELADITEISAAGGYSAGGFAVTTAWNRSGGTVSFVVTDATFTASGAAVGPFRYPVLYNDTASGDKLVGYLDYGSSITLADGEPLVLDFGASLFTLA